MRRSPDPTPIRWAMESTPHPRPLLVRGGEGEVNEKRAKSKDSRLLTLALSSFEEERETSRHPGPAKRAPQRGIR